MNTFILVGSQERIQDYLEKFKKENNVPSYYFTFFEAFKISDARLLQKTLFQKLGEHEKRLFVISNPTLEAQNAILKTIEELASYIFIFFVSNNREAFLPTVISRCKTVELGADVFEDKTIVEKLEQVLLGGEEMKLREIVDTLETQEELEKFILTLRTITLRFIKSGKDYRILFIFLKRFVRNFSLIKSNNLNIKLCLEATFFGT